MELQKFVAPDGQSLRAFVDSGGQPWICAADITKALGYANGADAVGRHCSAGGIVKRDTPTSSGVQHLTYLSEANLYRLVMRSKVAGAEAFQDWVCERVLPEIRRTGRYEHSAPQLPQTLPEALRAYAAEIDSHEVTRLQLAAAQPAVEAMQALHNSEAALSMEDVAKLLAIPDMGRNNLFAFLKRERVLIAKSNRPYQQYVGAGYFRVIQQEFLIPGGEMRLRPKTLVTPEGVVFIKRLVARRQAVAVSL